MLLLIIGGIIYALLADSIPASVIVASLILFRAQRPSPVTARLRDAWYARQAARIGE